MSICEFSLFFLLFDGIELIDGGCSVRFAPPLVIEEEDLRRAVKVIGECLEDLDNVCIFYLSALLSASTLFCLCSWMTFPVMLGVNRGTWTM